MNRQVTNTAEQAASNPMLGLALSMGGGIEAMEARGQAELVHSDQIPTKHLHGSSDAMLEAMGFVLGPVTPGDTLFRSATLPPGWSRKGTGHSMWSTIVDGKGRERLAIFYKAAFYDRAAHISLQGRFGVDVEYPEGDGPRRVFITDAGVEVEAIGEAADYDAQERLYDKARTKLDATRPDWRNPLAYWD